MNAAVLAAVPLTSIALVASCSSSPPAPPSTDPTATGSVAAEAWIAPHAGCSVVHHGAHGDAGAAPEAGSPGDDAAAPAEAGDDGGTDEGGSAGFYSCDVDADCVAVARVGCCHNGWLEAVNHDQADAYEASFTCPQPHPICPLYQVIDSRIPACDPATHQCAMVDSPDAQAAPPLDH